MQGSRNLTPEQNAAAEPIISTLRIDTNASCALLVDFSGQILITDGEPGDFNLSILGVLIAGGMATSLEIAHALDEAQIISLHYHKGLHHEVYSSIVDDQTLICLILDQDLDTSQIGMVWLFLKRTIEELQLLLSKTEHTDLTGAVEFDADIESVMDGIWVEEVKEISDDREDMFTEIEVQFASTEDENGLISFDSAVKLGIVDQE